MTSGQLEILQHALGVDQYGRGQMYRNHFCAGGADEDTCRELVALGYMATFTRSYLPYYNCTVTDAGKRAMITESPAPPKLTRGQQRYRKFLNADSGESFGDWLKQQARVSPENAEVPPEPLPPAGSVDPQDDSFSGEDR